MQKNKTPGISCKGIMDWRNPQAATAQAIRDRSSNYRLVPAPRRFWHKDPRARRARQETKQNHTTPIRNRSAQIQTSRPVRPTHYFEPLSPINIKKFLGLLQDKNLQQDILLHLHQEMKRTDLKPFMRTWVLEDIREGIINNQIAINPNNVITQMAVSAANNHDLNVSHTGFSLLSIAVENHQICNKSNTQIAHIVFRALEKIEHTELRALLISFLSKTVKHFQANSIRNQQYPKNTENILITASQGLQDKAPDVRYSALALISSLFKKQYIIDIETLAFATETALFILDTDIEAQTETALEYLTLLPQRGYMHADLIKTIQISIAHVFTQDNDAHRSKAIASLQAIEKALKAEQPTPPSKKTSASVIHLATPPRKVRKPEEKTSPKRTPRYTGLEIAVIHSQRDNLIQIRKQALQQFTDTVNQERIEDPVLCTQILNRGLIMARIKPLQKDAFEFLNAFIKRHPEEITKTKAQDIIKKAKAANKKSTDENTRKAANAIIKQLSELETPKPEHKERSSVKPIKTSTPSPTRNATPTDCPPLEALFI